MTEITVHAGTMEVGIVVRDLEAMSLFYRDGLGLAHLIDLAMPTGVMRRFACGDGVLKLMQLNDAPGTSNPPGGVLGGSTGLRWVTVMVDDIREVCKRCEAAGATLVMPIQEWENRTVFAILDDPEGNWVELIQRGSQLDEAAGSAPASR